MGSSLYQVAVSVLPVAIPQWQAISADCAGSIATLVELLQGRLSKAVMERICTPKTGLFPAPKEISFTCNCPDWADMCKHVAAVLYGIGVRLDEQPDLLFSLRRVDAKELVAQAGAGLPKNKKAPASTKVLDASLLADVFGIEMADATPPLARSKVTGVPEKKTGAGKKLPAAKKAAVIKKPSVAKKVTVEKKPAQVKKSASTRKSTGRKVEVAVVTPKVKSVLPKPKPVSVKKK